jgi:hypothetical protein
MTTPDGVTASVLIQRINSTECHRIRIFLFYILFVKITLFFTHVTTSNLTEPLMLFSLQKHCRRVDVTGVIKHRNDVLLIPS